MKLVIAAQDIASVTFGHIDGGNLKAQTTIQTSPEGYLSALDRLLRGWSVARADIEGVIVVTGPGSFTASRVSTTIANGLGFSLDVPVVGIENPQYLPLNQLDLSAIESTVGYVIPKYNRPPEITVAKNSRGDNISNYI